jgi:predicted lactoylglutathione lyase
LKNRSSRDLPIIPLLIPVKSTEVLLSFDAESRQEVDELAKKVTAAGGKVFAQPGENQGWMYAF